MFFTKVLMKLLTGHWKRNKITKLLSIAVLCNAVHLLQRLIERNIVPDTLTDQTSAHDPLIGYVPHTINNTQACYYAAGSAGSIYCTELR